MSKQDSDPELGPLCRLCDEPIMQDLAGTWVGCFTSPDEDDCPHEPAPPEEDQ